MGTTAMHAWNTTRHNLSECIRGTVSEDEKALRLTGKGSLSEMRGYVASGLCQTFVEYRYEKRLSLNRNKSKHEVFHHNPKS